MMHLPARMRVCLCLSPCDMGRSFDGLKALECDHLQLDPFAGHLYLFANKRRGRLNILCWARPTNSLQPQLRLRVDCRGHPKQPHIAMAHRDWALHLHLLGACLAK